MSEPNVPRLEWLKINKYRDVVPGQEIRFSPTFNVVLGQNATGKTTLLELISSCLGDSKTKIEEEFDYTYKLLFSTGSAVVRIVSTKRPTSIIEFLDTIKSVEIEEKFRFEINTLAELVFDNNDRIKVKSTGNEVDFTFNDSTTHFDLGEVSNYLFPNMLLEVFANRLQFKSLGMPIQHHIWTEVLWSWFQLRHVVRFDESLEIFSSITDSRKSKIYKMSYFTPTANIEISISGAVLLGPRHFPELDRGLLDSKIQNYEAFSDLRITESELGWLKNVAFILNVVSVELQFLFNEAINGKDSKTYSFHGLTIWIERRDGSVIRHEKLSYGQKRLLAFYYYLSLNPHIAIVDELVNGLHHSWIEHCMEELATRQSFLTSQNPLLLDYMQFDSAEHAQSSFIVCRLEDSKTPEGRTVQKMRWENFTKDEAELFYDAYKVGIEHVGEILKTRGLW